MKTNTAILAALSLTAFACEMDQTQNDLIRRVERSNATLFCSTNEPFASIAFNYQGTGTGAAPWGDGPVYFRYPNNTPPEFVGEEILTRTGGAYNEATRRTDFTLSQGMQGYIEETKEQKCQDDMAGTFHDYKITIEKWSADAPSNPPKTGCCTAINPDAFPFKKDQ